MKIGVMIDRLNVGGVEKIAIEEVKALKDLNQDTYLLVLRRKAVVEEAFKDILDDIQIIYLDDRLPDFLRLSVKIPFFYFFSSFHLTYPFLIPFVVKKNEFDFIISHNTYTSFTAITLSRFKKIPYAIYVWDPISYIIGKAYTKGPIKRLNFVLINIAKFVDRLIIDNAKFILVSGDLHAEYIKNILGSKKRIIFLPPGHSILSKIPKRRGNYIFTATAWKEGKGLEDLLKITQKVKGIKLIIAGKWIHENYKNNIMFLIKKLNIGNRIKICDEVSEKDLNMYYSRARAAININNERGFGLVALEAASNGCTFIITEDSGAARYFKRNKDGFYFKYGDLSSLERYIQKLINDENLAFRMGKHAWETVKNNYTWGKHAEALIKIINN